MLQPGTQVGRYEIQRRLGRGGMGTVYVAHDPVLGRMVAIKVFLSDLDLPDASERFTREARSAAALNHANIVTIHDFGDVASQPYIVMEYVQGETLAEMIRRKAPVSIVDKLRWMEELCAGVAYAHQVGVIHRDIKPTNLMVDRSGRLKVLDFGIAKMLGTLATNATALIGTPGYMAPEQILGKAIDHRSDLFSIGVVCYELLAYAEAFPGENVPAITHRILNAEPTPISQLVPDIHPGVVAIVERGLAKNVEERFESAEALRAAIGRLRRQLETEPGWDATSVSPRGATPTAGTGGRGTGSAREPVNNVVGVAELTPPPDPRRTDREALARRRATQIEAALETSRAFLGRLELEAALDACEQALTLDDTHAVALELEAVIKEAMAKQRAAAFLAEARTELNRGELTLAQSLLQQARTLDPEVPDSKRLDRDLRLARVEQERARQRADTLNRAVAAARDALARGEIEASLASAREALALDPDSHEAKAIEAEAMRRLDDDTVPGALAQAVTTPLPTPGPVDQTMIAPARPTPVPKTKKRPAVAVPSIPAAPRDVLAPVRQFSATAVAAGRSAAARMAIAFTDTMTAVNAAPKQQKQIAAAISGAVVIIAAVAAAVIMRPAPVVPTGVLVLDAVPWATISRIEREDGTEQPLPARASTPLSLTMPAGTYRIRVASPTGSDSRLITVTVGADRVTAAPVERFGEMTPEDYFEPYLAAQTPDPTADDTTAPASPEPDAAGALADPATASVKPPGTIQ
jgi:tetratricopeptide (TPR) repeat protein